MPIPLSQHCLLFGAAVIAGAINSVAGGGSFISFPALIFTGVNPISANATNNTALWLGTFASVGAYRDELLNRKRQLFIFGGVSLLGGLLGSVLLLYTSASFFSRLIPYLLLSATLLFTFSSLITKWLQVRLPKWSNPSSSSPPVGVLILQLFIAVYGGFFGGGMGILMLATLSVMGLGTIHTMNAFKSFLATCINGIAVIPFVIAGVVVWYQALLMSVGAIIGGYVGGLYAQKLNPILVKRFVILLGFTMTVYFFVKG